MQRHRIRDDLGVEGQVLTLRHDGDAVVADAPRKDHAIARPRLLSREIEPRGDDSDARRRNEHPVRLAAFHHLGVAGHHRNAGRARGFTHAVGDALEIREPETFLDDETRRKIERTSARHGDIVDRSVHGERADVAARKEQWRDHMAVGRHHHASAADVEGGLVVAAPQPFVVEGLVEDVSR